jgi:hypothetical protein
MGSSSGKTNKNIDSFVGQSFVNSQIFGSKEQVILFFRSNLMCELVRTVASPSV